MIIVWHCHDANMIPCCESLPPRPLLEGVAVYLKEHCAVTGTEWRHSQHKLGFICRVVLMILYLASSHVLLVRCHARPCIWTAFQYSQGTALLL